MSLPDSDRYQRTGDSDPADEDSDVVSTDSEVPDGQQGSGIENDIAREDDVAGENDIPLDPGHEPELASVAGEASADQDPLTAALAERDEYLDTLRRLQADLENYRKRMLRQQAENAERAAESLVVKLLPVFDALDLAVHHAQAVTTAAGSVGVAASEASDQSGSPSPASGPWQEQDVQPKSSADARTEDSDREAGGAPEASVGGQPEGLLQIRSMLLDILTREGLLRVDPEVGEQFDPALHEAVVHSPAEVPDGTAHAGPVVAEVMRVGYCWKGRIVRAAMVRVMG
ncbi:MAG: nucleotide exchange factor GrpE [Acidimicrobiales bacterium]